MDLVKTVLVGGQRLRVAVRPGAGDGPPLLVCNGIGTPLEALAPFTGALDPAITVVRFDVPGAGGSPATRLPYSVPWLAWLSALGRANSDCSAAVNPPGRFFASFSIAVRASSASA